MFDEIIAELKKIAEPDFAKWFLPYLSIDKNSKEKLLGIRVPKLRKLAKKYQNIDNSVLQQLLKSNYHEAKELAIFVMLIKSKKYPRQMCKLYLKNLKYINNWDLIDYSAPHIIAPNVDIKTLEGLSDSDYLWANRVAMVSTIYYIKQNDYALALKFAKKYIQHKHHLIHKASGWMLREIGKRDKDILLQFLKEHTSVMPTIMKNYATEHLKNFKY